MTHCIRIAAVLFLLPMFIYAQDSTRAAVPDTVLVKSVTGGTTFTTDDGRTITLLGLTVPKSRAMSASDAKEHLAEMIQGETVVLTADSLAPADTKKSVLRYVYNGSTLVNLAMIADGYGAPSTTKHSMGGTFKETHDDAKTAHRGAYATERSTAVQCSATTKKGTQCSRMTTNLSGRCWQHE